MKKYSKKWMQTFIDGQLPSDDDFILTEVSKKGFEVEGFEKTPDGDSLFEIKVLPNRIADALSIRGMAREFAAVFNLKWGGNIPVPNLADFKLQNDFLIAENNDRKPLYIFTGVKVNNFDNGVPTPAWIKEIIEKSGGRSINCLVDITNLMLLSFGQPAHVFDADKLTGKIVTRFAKDGEELELLDGKKVKLTATDFVIADESRALSLAGIKGGKFAETTTLTKNAFFEMANFNPTMIRKTSARLSIRTDASKIFENGITTNKTEEVLGLVIATINELDKNAEIEFIVNKKFEDKSPTWVEMPLRQISDEAGTEIVESKVLEYLNAQNFKTEIIEKNNQKYLKVLASGERLDVNIPEDVAEEVIRLYGFDNIKSVALNLDKNKVKHDTRFLLENYLKVSLLEKGFTEIFTYTFVDKGQVKLKAGLAEDKMFLRDNLFESAKNAFTKNYNYLPVLKTDVLKFFEIGTAFYEDGDEKRVVIAKDDNKKKTKYLPDLENLVTEIFAPLGLTVEIIKKQEKPAMLEFSLDKLVRECEEKNIVVPFLPVHKNLQDIKYKPLSVYPFIVRDIACFLPHPTSPYKGEEYSAFKFETLKKEIEKLNLENVTDIYMFDTFTKEGKTSIAFRVIFQSNEKTLTDAEVENEMQKVNNYLKENNFEIR